jgi:hypothetical protein
LRQKTKVGNGSDAQLWCFVGDNADGFLIYLKAEPTKNIGLNDLKLSTATSNQWLIARKEGKYSFFDPNREIKTANKEAQGIHAGGGGTNGNILIYNDNNDGSKWLFEEYIPLATSYTVTFASVENGITTSPSSVENEVSTFADFTFTLSGTEGKTIAVIITRTGEPPQIPCSTATTA